MKQYNIMGGIDQIENKIEVEKGVLYKLINDNYDSIVKRGLITSQTTKEDFINKLNEEISEFIHEYNERGVIDPEELSDIILVCFNMAKHYDINIEEELKNKIKTNFKR